MPSVYKNILAAVVKYHPSASRRSLVAKTATQFVTGDKGLKICMLCHVDPKPTLHGALKETFSTPSFLRLQRHPVGLHSCARKLFTHHVPPCLHPYPLPRRPSLKRPASSAWLCSSPAAAQPPLPARAPTSASRCALVFVTALPKSSNAPVHLSAVICVTSTPESKHNPLCTQRL